MATAKKASAPEPEPEQQTTPDAPPIDTEPLYSRTDKVRAVASLALGLILVAIAVDVLTGGKITGRVPHGSDAE